MAKIKFRPYKLPESIERSIASILKKQYKIDLYKDSEQIAKAVLRMSDFYIASEWQATPWHESWAQIAQLAYYLPLNFIRNLAVLEALKRNEFFKHHTELNIHEYGSGLGPSQLALDYLDLYSQSFAKNYFSNEISPQAQNLSKAFDLKNIKTDFISSFEKKNCSDSLALFSYSLTEYENLPMEFWDYAAHIIIEPANQSDSIRLKKIREQALQQGYYAWAPCTHQQTCPLLNKNDKVKITDWCHDKVEFEQNQFFKNIEAHLPIKNLFISFSYLVLSKKTPNYAPEMVRIVGDLMNEKGKSRQLICRGPEREFLSWIHSKHEVQEIARGQRLFIPPDFEKKSNEIRMTKKLEVLGS